MADDDEPVSANAVEPPHQLELPFATPEETAKFFDILMQMKAGTLAPDAAHVPILQLYDTSLGAWVRALSRSHPKVAARIAAEMKRDLEHLTQNLENDRNHGVEGSSRPKGSRSGTTRLGSKLVEILERERIVLESLMRLNEPQTLAELRRLVAKAEPDIEAAALTANLDRLEKDGIIDRPRKGYYARNDSSLKYLDALKTELDARGSKKR